uniref:Putative resolvase R771 n=1 Tax=Lygus hesperus TaxID=30085 RepID=A0A146MCH0_LYGHE
MDAKYVSGAAIKRQYNISTQSLHRWCNDGKIQSTRTPGGNRLYSSANVARLFGADASQLSSQKKKVCYARVSSDHQKEDLERQISALKQLYPDHEIIQDVGSGLNFKRRGFNSLLDRVRGGEIEEIVVMYKDRLCRFGYELVKFIYKKASCRIVVHNATDKPESDDTQELSEDLLSIVTVFVARNNGLRAGKNKRRRKELET